MIFRENVSNPELIEYSVTDIFGEIKITSPTKLEGKMLDAIVEQVLKSGTKQMVINDTIKTVFIPDNAWQEDE